MSDSLVFPRQTHKAHENHVAVTHLHFGHLSFNLRLTEGHVGKFLTITKNTCTRVPTHVEGGLKAFCKEAIMEDRVVGLKIQLYI